jgi:hypothetical protein
MMKPNGATEYRQGGVKKMNTIIVMRRAWIVNVCGLILPTVHNFETLRLPTSLFFVDRDVG